LIQKEKDDKVFLEQEVGLHETTTPVAETSPVVEARTGASSPWDPLFNPELFLEKMVDMAGNSFRFQPQLFIFRFFKFFVFLNK
jgi:hypothetical protein